MSDSNDESIVSEGFVIGACVPFWTRPGFAIPIIQSQGQANTLYVQLCDVSGLIKGFVPIEAIDFLPAVTAVPIALETAEVFAYINKGNDLIIGTQEALRSYHSLRKKEFSKSESALTQFYFDRFIGNHTVNRNGLTEILEEAQSILGKEDLVIAWFTDIVVRKLLRDRLLEMGWTWEVAEGASCSVSIAARNVHVIWYAAIQSYNQITDVWSGQAINLSLKVLQERFGFDISVSFNKKEMDNISVIGHVKLDLYKDFMRDFPRQETRLAMIMLRILEDGEMGIVFAKNYPQETKYINSCLGLLFSRFDETEFRLNPEAGIAKFALQCLRIAVPFRRKRIKAEIQSALNSYPEVRKALS